MQGEKRYSLITRVPVQAGSLQRATAVVAAAGANINRIHYDRGIDPQTVFWELTCEASVFSKICESLQALGYLRAGFNPLAMVSLTLRLPHTPGALNELLRYTTKSDAVITALAFDDKGSSPDTVTVTLALDEHQRARHLIAALAGRFTLEKVDVGGPEDISFYTRFVEQLSATVPDADPSATVELVISINRVAQDLMRRGEKPKLVFEEVLEGARTIADTLGPGFYADVQTRRLSDEVTLHCVQPPCGGNVYLFETRESCTMLDTGYGLYHADLMRLFGALGMDVKERLSRIILSHGDVDHSGAAGFFKAPVLMHPAAYETLRTENRARGSLAENTILQTVYSKMICTVSGFKPPRDESVRFIDSKTGKTRGDFPVLCEIEVGDLCFEVLESLGGHQVGEIFLFNEAKGYLFTADSLIALHAISKERARYNRVADFLMTSVNVNSDLARQERRGLLALAAAAASDVGTPCVIFGGHGPVCVERDGTLHPENPAPIRYVHD